MAVFGDNIFTETDLSYRLASVVRVNLEREGLLEQTYHCTVTINRIASRGEGNTFAREYDFSRTASRVFRMCFLQSLNINEKYWPGDSDEVQQKNCDLMIVQREGTLRSLVASERDARKYYSRYDHLNPHFFIEEKMEDPIRAGVTINWERGMMIFMRNLSELVNINTAVEFERSGDKVFKCKVTVSCYHYKIRNTDGPNTYLYPIRALIEPDGFRINALPREMPDESFTEEQSEESDEEGDVLAPNQDDTEVNELADRFQEQAAV